MLALQEELDWRCYRLYGLHESPPEYAAPPPLRLGERAFEIVMARQIAAGELETTWFARHGSAPITSLPSHWPDDYRQTVEQRIVLIETDPNIGMIERPEFKRRWSSEPWELMEQDALRTWLLERMEAPSHLDRRRRAPALDQSAHRSAAPGYRFSLGRRPLRWAAGREFGSARSRACRQGIRALPRRPSLCRNRPAQAGSVGSNLGQAAARRRHRCRGGGAP